jgi:Beta-L-arabinofuranosidase, GH127
MNMNKRIFFVIMICSWGCLVHAQNNIKATMVKHVATTQKNSFYTGNKSPLLPLHFIKLPVGSIEPQGWLLKYLQLQRDGLTGQLGKISAWLDKNNNAWFSGNGKGDHGWEEAPYWLKGYGNLAYLLKDEAMVAETKLWIEKVLQSQEANGYFGPRVMPNEKINDKDAVPDIWPNMIMLWCLQSYYEYSRDVRIISFMTKYFKWQTTVPENKLLTTYWENSRGGDNLYSIYWLYNRTGDVWLLDLAHKIHRCTANWAQTNNLPNWHNVNVAQCFREPATYFMQVKDSTMLQATYHDFQLIRNLYGQVPGGLFGADENARQGYDDPKQAVETCGMVEQMASDEILIGITGDAMWADNCEDVAFNTYPAAVMPDFRGLRYLTAPNMVISDGKNHAPGIQNEGPFLVMNPFSSRCCQHNHAQGWPYYAEHLWMATPDNGLAAILYNNSSVTAKAGTGKGNNVTLMQTTHYPFDENVKIEVSTASVVEFPLYLRIPAWCDEPSVTVNGKRVPVKATPGSYIRLENKWKNGDIIELTLPMRIVLRTWSKNKNSVSVDYGPLTFSLKIKEAYKAIDSRKAVHNDSKWQPNADQSQWPAFEIFPVSMWNYGLLLSDKGLKGQFEIIRRPWPVSDFPFTLNDVPIVIKSKGKIVPDWILDRNGMCDVLPQSPVSVNTNEEVIELVPMGAARLRISSFPVVR